MTSAESKAKDIIKRWDRMKNQRSTYENVWQNIRDLVRPGAQDFQRQVTPGSTRTDAAYDGTARESNEELSGGIHSYLTNPIDRWFGLRAEGEEELMDDLDALFWLEQAADTIYAEYNHPKVRFQTSIREDYKDIGAFGTGILNQEWSQKTGHLRFSTKALASCWLDTDSEGLIDTVFRCIKWDKRQLIQEFGIEALPQRIRQDEDETKQYEVIHAVYPRSDRDETKITSYNMPFASCWVLISPSNVGDGPTILRESGYTSFPYHVGRWETVAEEIYGYSPAHTCLPDIRMLQRMEYTIIKAAQKATDPPIWTYSEGVMLPVKTSPGSVNYVEPHLGEQPFWTMEHKGNFPISLETSDRKRAMIKKAYRIDWVEITRKKERQTAYELQQDEEENIRQMGPILGGLQSDVLHPAISRSYELLTAHRRIPPPPESLADGRPVRIVYVSPAARAQKAMKAISIGRYIADLTPWAQVQPEVLDAVDGDAMAQELALAREVPRRVIRGPEAIKLLRDKREAMQAMAAAEPASQAILNIAKARETGMAA